MATSAILSLSDRIDLLPVIHGSGDMAIRVRQQMLEGEYDCVAVPLPASFEPACLEAIEQLPIVSAVIAEDEESCTYVPIDPCQPVIAALRFALSERIATEFIDLEVEHWESQPAILPDAYALKGLSLERFATAILPFLTRPSPDRLQDRRVRRMAFELHRLELERRRILCLASIVDWPWLREAYRERRRYPDPEATTSRPRIVGVNEETLMFFLGEIPYITALYEKARETIDPDENLAIDGVKLLLLEARDRWSAARPESARWLTPKLLALLLQYVRNLTVMGRRLSPDLYTLVTAAKQIGGDGFALRVVEVAREYLPSNSPWEEELSMGIGRGALLDGSIRSMKSRLPGMDVEWRACELRPEPPPTRRREWKQRWDPHGQCSWPPEDQRIESFHSHVREQAKEMLGADLARVEKFTTSVKDGIDIRETLRHWHKKELWVREIPPTRGSIEVVTFLFEVPADADRFTWRATWHSEHPGESTIAFYATDFREDLVGPGIGRARYGGVMFIYPPRYIPDVWTDPRIQSLTTLEERLIAAACLHSQERHVAVVSPTPLRARWRRIARGFRRRLIHLPLSRFSGRIVDRLRTVHVLNGKDVRSYAASFIRDQ